jgi:hypothetical protein
MYNKSMQAIPRSYVFKSFIQKRSFSIPQQWKGLARFKNPKVENNIVEKENGEVLEIYKKLPSGEVSKRVEHRFAGVPEHVIDIKELPADIVKKLFKVK